MTDQHAKATVLSLDAITRRFGSVVAVDNASFTLRAGTVHALLGENGAGKTTLMRMAFGLLAADSGTIRVRGVPTTIPSPAAALALGIGMVHQHFTLVPAMTVAENVALGGHGRFAPQLAEARVHEVAARAGLAVDASALVSSLPVGAQQRVEIIKALARDVDVLILDEPTAVLAPPEAAELMRWIRRFADDGHAVVLITHKLRDALAIADDVTVLRRGRSVLTAAARDTTEDALRAAMVGTTEPPADAGSRVERGALEGSAAATAGPPEANAAPVIAARDISYVDARGATRVQQLSLNVNAGEIVGIAAVEGAGQHELLRLLAGRLLPQHGTIQAPARLGFVPEDRHRDALLLDAPLYENVALRGAGARTGRMVWKSFVAQTSALMQRYDVRATNADVSARTLSGGNQQKLVLGRELSDTPDALIVENPSRGLDFQATAAVHAALRAARDAGAAVVVYSSDLDEVLLLADRVCAMYNGQLFEVPADRDVVGRAMLGAL
ncbi:MAG: ATP-binding cassette domain-containing protein [Gemmatimonadaceae bacterium]|nr:ATP-binding cassette domain-containing protein [Gemmatimonadaceae bacterium]